MVPPRIELFSWLALLGRINTKEKLVRIGIISGDENSCVLCNESTENYNHTLLHCPFSWAVWTSWLSIWNLKWVFPSNLREAFDQWKFLNKGRFFKKVGVAMFFILIWTIWKERNCIIFNNCSRSVAETLEMALLQLRWWISGWKEPFPYSFDEILKNQSCLIWNESTGAINFINPQVCMQHWEPPPINHLKWIIDASVMASQSGSTIGGILRNNEGKFKCMFSSPIPPIEINCAEILAIY